MIFNQKVIQNKNLIKEIEEKGAMVCKDKPHYVCVPKEDIYYYYNNNVIRIQKTISRSVEDQEAIRQAMLKAIFPNGIDKEVHTKFKNDIRLFQENHCPILEGISYLFYFG